MKKQLLYLSILSLMLHAGMLQAQITPFSLPPKWYFGHRAGLDFTGGAPVSMGGNVWDGASYANQEGATTECLPSGNVLYYSNSCVLANSGNANFGPNPITTTGNSSTQGCISIPNPANPTTSFYFITTDVDGSGGSDCATGSRGLNYFGVSTVPAIGGATNLAAADIMGECVAVSSDNAGGYWIVSHSEKNDATSTRYFAYRVSSTGVVNTTAVTSTGTVQAADWRAQATLKFNKCNTRIGYVTRSGWEVYQWDTSTGSFGALVRSGSVPGGYGYGCEFSPNGNVFYFTDLEENLYHVDLATGTQTSLGSGTAGSNKKWGNLQIGPDDKIYISNNYAPADPGPKYLGVISSPNSTSAAACGFVETGAGAFSFGAGSYPSSQAGLITLGWHNPRLPIIAASSPCTQLSYTYNQYYGTAIPVQAGSEEWDFGAGWVTGLGATPTHNFGAVGSYPVKLRVRDQNCLVFYENTQSITVSCTAPVELVNFKGKPQGQGVLLSWQTASEVNNDYFELQRSVDGVNFEAITKVNGAGNSSELNSYEYSDLTATSKIVYYRLVQHDFDGATTSSSIVTVYLDKTYSAPIVVMPNPFSSSFTLTKLRLEEATILVYDILGRQLEQRSTLEGESVVELGSALASGTYLVQYLSGSTSYTLRVEKQ